METLKAIAQRKSTRKFKAEQIPETKLQTILAAGSLAPVGHAHYRTIHFTVVQEPAIRKQISDQTAQLLHLSEDPIYQAPTLVLISGFPDPDCPHIEYANTSTIAENMLLAATDLGIDSIYLWSAPTAVHSIPALRKVLRIPDGFKPIAAIALGYAETADRSEKKLKSMISTTRI